MYNKDNTLTIAVQTYNRSKYLDIMLESIQNQTYRNFKVLILDNCSTDDTKNVVMKYLKDNRFKYICHEKNLGAVQNGNEAIHLCDTDLLLLTHDDDIMEPDFIKEEISYFNNSEDIILVNTIVNEIDENGNFLEKKNEKKDKVYNQFQFIDAYINDFYGSNIVCPTVMLNMKIIRKTDFHIREDVGKSSDTFSWFELNLLPGRFITIGKPLYKYRRHAGQDSMNWLYMLPLLRGPIYNLLKKNRKYKLANEWLEFITPYTIKPLMAGKYSDKELVLLKNNFFGCGIKDFPLYRKLFIKELKRKIKKNLGKE